MATATAIAVMISCGMKATPPAPPSALLPKMPAAMPPQAPHRPCSGHTPSTSSIFQRFWVSVNMMHEQPAGHTAD